MRRTIEDSIKAGENVTRTAERLLELDDAIVELPRYVEDLAKAAKFPRGAGDPSLYEEAVSRWKGQIGRLGQGASKQAGEYTIRSSTQELVARLRRAKPEQVDALVDRWVLDRARYQARVVARNESVEAMREMKLASFQEQPWVHGVRIVLSPGHPVADICDLLAGADQYGLGPGGYPKDQVPDRHVNCICSLAAIADPHHLDRELAQENGDEEPPRPWETGVHETAEEWLARQAPERRKAIVGPTRARLIEKGQKVYEPGAAGFKPVHELLGKAKPTRTTGPRINARKLVMADRAKMAQPYPDLKRANSKR